MQVPGLHQHAARRPENSANSVNVPVYGTFRYTYVSRIPVVTGDNMKVTEVSRHSYCMYYLLDSSAYVIAPGVNSQASELGKHPLFRRTGYGPTALTQCRASDLRHVPPLRRGCPSATSGHASMFNNESLSRYSESDSRSPGPRARLSPQACGR